jgi:hypothetical protein
MSKRIFSEHKVVIDLTQDSDDDSDFEWISTAAVRRVTRLKVTTPSGDLPRPPSAETVIDVKEETKPSRDKVPPKGKSPGMPPMFVALPNRYYCF